MYNRGIEPFLGGNHKTQLESVKIIYTKKIILTRGNIAEILIRNIYTKFV